jgi:RNA polymerase sigma factor for flagellar operon FliA
MAFHTEARPREPDLPPYQGIALADIRLVRTAEEARAAQAALLAHDAIGFDTESKPTFVKGQSSDGPHLVQFADENTAWLFPVGPEVAPLLPVLKAILESAHTLKVGFGLADDVKRLRAKLAIEPERVADLSKALRVPGQKHDLGAKSAVAHYFGLKLQKSKKISTTNWASPRLTDKQLQYAADDAQVALRVYRHWLALGNALPQPKAARQRRPISATSASLATPTGD